MTTQAPAGNSSLVVINNGEPRTTTLAIAEGTENQHKAVIQLVRKFQSKLEVFGSLTFEMAVMRQDRRGGQQAEYALLNEPQATLLMTFMRNSEIVVDFKVRLVKAFYSMKAPVAPPQETLPPGDSPDGNRIREEDAGVGT